MNAPALNPVAAFADYSQRLQTVLQTTDWSPVGRLAEELHDCWRSGRQVFICGNGGSAGNAVHLANDFLYGISKTRGSGLRVNALPANSAVLTCLANDEGYDEIYSLQLAVQARAGDVLIVLSGSGNSANILKALEQANAMKVRTYAILGYTGGKARAMADVALHFPVEDMQISEDMQLIAGHMIMQWLYKNQPAME
jgi:D-sedoheptulose 7-phosphate isomerase